MTTIYVLVALLGATHAFSGVQAHHANNDTQYVRAWSTGVRIATGNTHARLGIPVGMDFKKRLEIPGDPINPVSVPAIRIIQVRPRNPASEDFRSPGGVIEAETRFSNPTLWRNPNSMSMFPIPFKGARGPLRSDLPGQHGGGSPFLEGLRVSGVGSDVDMPFQYGNLSPHPVVHRYGSGHTSNDPPHIDTDVYVDLAGRHGNDSQHPFVHRKAAATGAPLGSQMEIIRSPTLTGERSTQSMHGRSMDTSRQFPGEFGLKDTFFGTQVYDRVHGFPPMLRRMPMTAVGGRVPLLPRLISVNRPFGFSPRGLMSRGHNGNRRRPFFVQTEIPVAGKPQFTPGESNLGNIINQGSFPLFDVHIATPVQHGNTGGTAVVHRGGFNMEAVLNPTIVSNIVDNPAETDGTRGKPEHRHEPTAPASTNSGSGITVIQVRKQKSLRAPGDALGSAFGIGGQNGGGQIDSLLNTSANVEQPPHIGPPRLYDNDDDNDDDVRDDHVAAAAAATVASAAAIHDYIDNDDAAAASTTATVVVDAHVAAAYDKIDNDVAVAASTAATVAVAVDADIAAADVAIDNDVAAAASTDAYDVIDADVAFAAPANASPAAAAAAEIAYNAYKRFKTELRSFVERLRNGL